MSKHSLLAAAAAPQQNEEEEKQRQEHPTSSTPSYETNKTYPSCTSANSSTPADTDNVVVIGLPSHPVLPSEPKRAGNTSVCASSASSSPMDEPRLNHELLVGGIPSSSDITSSSVAAVQVQRVARCFNGISNSKSGGSTGRWTAAEHEAFLNGLRVHGREWKKVARLIPSRTAAQIRSHAQKYFAKLARDARSQNAVGTHLQVVPSMSGELGASAHGLAPLVPRQAAEGSGNVAIGSGNAQEVPQGLGSDSMALRKSVVERVSRIMQDPDSVQAEVEQTLQALRERYSKLQRQLQQPRAAPPTSNPPSRPSHVIQPERDCSSHIKTAVPSQNDTSLHSPVTASSPIPTPAPRRADDNTVVSPNVNSVGESRSTEPPSVKSHDFFSKELIALSVLGRSLPCSAPSKTKPQGNLPRITLQQDKSPPSHPQIQSSPNDASTAPHMSSVTSNQSIILSSKPAKQVREICSDTDDSAISEEPHQKRQKTMGVAARYTTTMPTKEEEKSYP